MGSSVDVAAQQYGELMSTKYFTAVGAALTLALLVGCTAATSTERNATAEEVAPTPSATVEAPPEPDGTRALPWPTGLAAKYGSTSVWTFTFGTTAVDQYSAIAAFNEFADAPPEGSVYITAPVELALDDTEQTASGADPWGSLSITYVTASGNTADECLTGLPEPGDLYDVGTMYGGATAEFLACAIVAADEVSGGTWAVRSSVDADSVAFFVGAE